MNNKNIFSELRDSFKYLFQSMQGKYSLDTYLEVLSEFTDSEIREGQRSGLVYRGGEVEFITTELQDDIEVIISLEFQDCNDEWKLKKAERKLEKSMFVQESIDYLNNIKKVAFDIEQPKE